MYGNLGGGWVTYGSSNAWEKRRFTRLAADRVSDLTKVPVGGRYDVVTAPL